MWITIILVFLFIFLIRLYLTKDNLIKINKISDQFTTLLKTNGHSEAPSNAIFNNLVKMAFGDINPTVNTQKTGYMDDTRCVFIKTAGILNSFPTIHPQLIEEENGLIRNLQDYYKYKYSENFSIAYWIRLIIFLPSNVVNYLGLKDDSIIAKLLNIIYWIFIPLLTVMRSNLIFIVHELLK